MLEPQTRDSLPPHPAPHTPPGGVIRVCGLVERPLTLTVADLELLPAVELLDDFTCLEGWRVPALGWRGPALATVVEQARPAPSARWVTVASGDFAASLPLSEVRARTAVLALALEGAPLLREHGGPCRLVVRGGACFTSVKWVDRIELAAIPSQTAEEVARRRLAAHSA